MTATLPLMSRRKVSHYKKYKASYSAYYRANKDKWKLDGPYGKDKKVRDSTWRLSLPGKYSSYKANAKRRKIEWALTKEEFTLFWQKPCSYCAAEIETIGLDRMDPSQGYVVSNIVSCCWRCNEMKSDRSVSEFIEACTTIVNKQSVTTKNLCSWYA